MAAPAKKYTSAELLSLLSRPTLQNTAARMGVSKEGTKEDLVKRILEIMPVVKVLDVYSTILDLQDICQSLNLPTSTKKDVLLGRVISVWNSGISAENPNG